MYIHYSHQCQVGRRRTASQRVKCEQKRVGEERSREEVAKNGEKCDHHHSHTLRYNCLLIIFLFVIIVF